MKFQDLEIGKVYKANPPIQIYYPDIILETFFVINKTISNLEKDRVEHAGQDYDRIDSVLLDKSGIVKLEKYAYWIQEFEEIS